MNHQKIRSEYAFFKKNSDVIYFDNNSSSLKPNCVVESVNNYNSHISTSAGRGIYKLGFISSNLVYETRKKIAHLINANENEIVFTKNATDSLNLVVLSYVLNNLKAGDEIVLSLVEHHSLSLPLIEAAKKTQAKLVYAPLNEQHKLTPENLKKVLTKNTRIVALTHISNITGIKLEAKECIKLAHEVGAIVILDSAQAVPHIKVDVKELNCDFLAFSGYKMGAPTGVGVLYGKYNLLQSMKPVYFGGGMVNDTLGKEIEYKEAPYKFEYGTISVGDIIGLGSAVDFINEIGFNNIEEYENTLKNYLLSELNKIKGIEIYNNPDIATVIFNVKNIHAHDAATMYDMFNICVRAGHNCVQSFVNYIGQVSVLRASLYFYNTKEEIDKFIEATKQIVLYFNKF